MQKFKHTTTSPMNPNSAYSDALKKTALNDIK